MSGGWLKLATLLLLGCAEAGVMAATPADGEAMFFTGGCRVDDGACLPVAYVGGGPGAAPSHDEADARHNACADRGGPHPNKYWFSAPAGPGTGADAVVRGFCFDGVHWHRGDDGVMRFVLWDVDTARYGGGSDGNRGHGGSDGDRGHGGGSDGNRGHDRGGGGNGDRPVAASTRRRILTRVLGNILRRSPAAAECRHEYVMRFADRELVAALAALRDTGRIDLAGPSGDEAQKAEVETLDGLLREAGAADLSQAKSVVLAFLEGRRFDWAQSCDD